MNLLNKIFYKFWSRNKFGFKTKKDGTGLWAAREPWYLRILRFKFRDKWYGWMWPADKFWDLEIKYRNEKST